MSLFTSLRAVDRSPVEGDLPAEDPESLPAKHVETQASLPRHLLVSLAGITGDVTALQQRCVDAPDLHADLERILGKLDGLVDSIYQRAAGPAGPSVHRSHPAADPLSDALAAVHVDFAAASHGTRSPHPSRTSIPQPSAGRSS